MGQSTALHEMKLRILQPPRASILRIYGDGTRVSNLALWPANKEFNSFRKVFFKFFIVTQLGEKFCALTETGTYYVFTNFQNEFLF
jgi:hypothetical protein